MQVKVVISKNMIQFLRVSDLPIWLACLSMSDWSAVVQLWYVYTDEKIYCAAKYSQDNKISKTLPKCGFEIAGNRFPIVVLKVG